MNTTALRGRDYIRALALCVVACGCATSPEDSYFRDVQSHANVYVAPVPSPIRKIAILPFKAPTELIGQSISDLFVTEMLRANRYELVERSQMSKVLSESELALAGVSAAKAAAVGQMLGAEGVVIGTVDEYATVAQGGHPYPSVGVSVRMIDCASGKVMWSADLASVASSKKTTLPMESRLVTHELVAGLYRKWRVQPKCAARVVAAAEAPAPPADSTVRRTASVAVEPAPVAPPVFKVSDLGLREVRITWSAPTDGAQKYRIERARSEDGPFEKLAEVSAGKEKFTDTGLQDSTGYFYRLVALAADGAVSTPSKVCESMTAPPPEPPPQVRAMAPASRALRVAWDSSPAEAVVRYAVERATAAAGPFVKVGEVDGVGFEEGGTPTTDLRDSTKYFYRVMAINRVGAQGPPSPPTEVVTLPPPAPVTGLTAQSAEVRCVPLTWVASPENDVVRYDLYRRTDTNAPLTLLASVKGREVTRYLDGGQNPGNLLDLTEYQYTIRAINAVTAESAPAEPVTAITRDVPPAPTDVVAQSGQPRQVSIAWAVSPDEKVTGYEVYGGDQEDSATNKIGKVAGRETTTYVDRGPSKWFGKGALGQLKDGTDYTYRVSALNTAGAASPCSAPVRAKTKLVPVAPAGLAATTKLVKSVKLTFHANPEKDVAAYVVEAAPSADGKFKEIARVESAAGELGALEGGLADGAQRFYRIKAIDRDTLEGVWSEVVAGATKPLPAPPTELQWKAETKELRWTASVTPDVKQYKIWKSGFLGAELLVTVTSTCCPLTAAQVGKQAKVMVSAVDTEGLESPRSAALTVASPK